MSAKSGLHRFWQEFNDLDGDTEYFVTARLFDGTPAIWPNAVDYLRWRHEVAKRLGVDPAAVQLVGSARLGYSLNPDKNFKTFDAESDLDIAIISPEIFELTWVEIRSFIGSRRDLHGKKTYLRKLVFEECIALDIVLPHLTYGEQWSYHRDEIVSLLGGELIDREIKYRLYRSHRALREYQLKGVSTARDRAIEEGLQHVG
ncbi:hypothetical protein [Mycolicibacterium stellerae]|uniref:hypothetical protein n=1 Tax=Mycolicibacterium stellerae TaxID=2358193 RepID=UPI000F0B75B7|nr:hypothetical protein [Mycolicibacterium stellerae]